MGLSIQTIRFYERKLLIPQPSRRKQIILKIHQIN
ncbi:MAG: MerR family DNA-binding transcriptional regulator [Gammaproteobacteria bacterium]|nr:MerR family DNA-binding transcriptional regulator [Gammaproteobacteria bacterium]